MVVQYGRNLDIHVGKEGIPTAMLGLFLTAQLILMTRPGGYQDNNIQGGSFRLGRPGGIYSLFGINLPYLLFAVAMLKLELRAQGRKGRFMGHFFLGFGISF